MDLSPTPEFMEAMGRLIEKYGSLNAAADNDATFQSEMESMRKHGDTVRAGLVDVQDQHRAVAQRYPQLYRRQQEPETD
jgi:hypothetical protein